MKGDRASQVLSLLASINNIIHWLRFDGPLRTYTLLESVGVARTITRARKNQTVSQSIRPNMFITAAGKNRTLLTCESRRFVLGKVSGRMDIKWSFKSYGTMCTSRLDVSTQ
ncbi:hypothetical protein KIN20_003469 [Parelaphostrongylus tenuis]|uniref:Uncharacterized protein n=1 Tax=Parelaphostrongylus tenuis TaxID=148309 RepID=A0AAD5MIF2_PARTN|nr:hypothetical protein KIN20_003469 [Parelaphostrongylus tenuis]